MSDELVMNGNVNKRSRSWCFTLNNPQKLSEQEQNQIKAKLSACRYWVIGFETGSNGTPHWQGFLMTHNPVRMATVKELLLFDLSKAHIEACKGTPFQNVTYCKKGGEWEEHGDPPMSQEEKGAKGSEAQKRKWASIIEDARAGKWRKLEDEFPRELITSYRTLKQIRMENMRVNKTLQGPLEHEWLWGQSGCGKSSRARRENPTFYLKDTTPGSEHWWDFYDMEDVILVEDVSPYNKKFTDALKVWSDRYPFKAQVKGAYMQIRPRKIVVTSQYRIDQIWEDQETRDALHRRFKEIEVNEAEEREKRIREEIERESEINLDEEI